MTDPAVDDEHNPGLVGNVIGAVVPPILRQIDLDEVVEQLDVDAIAGQLDLDALLARIDIDALAERLDLDALVARMDVNAIAESLDLDALIARIDIDTLAERLDLDALVARMDVNTIAESLDLDALIARMDITALAKELDMAEIAGGATQDVAVSGLDLFRRQINPGRRHRRRSHRADHPTQARQETRGPRRTRRCGSNRKPRTRRNYSGGDVNGHYAGPVTRILAVIADVAIVTVVQAGVFAGLAFVINLFTDPSSTTEFPPWLFVIVWWTVFVVWFWVPVAFFGRTIAMAFLGLAVVRRDGKMASGSRALVRAIFFPFSLIIPLMFIGLFFGRERRAFHDVMAGTVVIYDWGSREAEQPVTIRQQFSARALRRHDQLSGDADAEPTTDAVATI